LAGRTRSSNHRASLAVLFGVVAVAAVPAGVVVAQRVAGVTLIDAAYAIPVAAVAAVSALLFVRGARGRIQRTLERAGGAGRARLGRILGIAGISIALSAAIAVGFYELLVRLEH
jgi:ABC-type sugar transport system permease subunit